MVLNISPHWKNKKKNVIYTSFSICHSLMFSPDKEMMAMQNNEHATLLKTEKQIKRVG